ncbi:nose resistant to fluoxetine protein 6-like [Neodiprion pinetum]|uniref:nose resistant to fluoxetine protein 6-like n=1 Tax=Neodiprion pinetum TaxID=441929 RepID=UPI001EE052E6|nr:nose resistant to fluoxetine protein 6-like [Neodiprion pinetum]
MFFCHDKYVLVLLFTSIQSFVRPSLGEKAEEIISLEESINSPLGPWIKGVERAVRSSKSSCANEVMVLVKAIESGQTWALQMLDASSKMQSGILIGNVRDLGSYDECVEAKGRYNNVSIQGKHCVVLLGEIFNIPNVPIIKYVNGQILSSFCVPSSCNETQVEQMINAILQRTSNIRGLTLGASGASCARLESENFTIGEISTTILLSLFGAFMIFCTVCDFFKSGNPTDTSKIINTLAKFSLYKNALALLSTEIRPETLPAIQGIRFLSISWIIFGHHFIVSFLRPSVNSLHILKWLNSWESAFIQGALYAVDTFFVVSGFMMTYLFLRAMKSGKKISIPMLYFHRYLRLTPGVVVLILFVRFFLHRVANGPLWKMLLNLAVKPCDDNWWVNLLYLQNLVNPENICLLHTWYLAADMQLFWISPIIIYPLYYRPKYGLRILICIFVALVVMSAVMLVTNEYSNVGLQLNLDKGEISPDNIFYFYMRTYNRASAYFVGILLGYDVTNNKRQLSKANVRINWIVSSVLMLFCLWAMHYIYSPDYSYNLPLETVFALTLRPFWSIAIAWILYACIRGYGGPVSSFLSMPFFQPLGRLSYSIYLVHFVIQAMRNAAARTPTLFSNFEIVTGTGIDLVLSVGVAFVFSLFFESPILILQKIIYNHAAPESENVALVQPNKKSNHKFMKSS